MKKILIVNDDDQMRQNYSRLFVCAGFLVRQAIDPQEIVDILIKEQIDAVILDFEASLMDGPLIRDLIEVYDLFNHS